MFPLQGTKMAGRSTSGRGKSYGNLENRALEVHFLREARGTRSGSLCFDEYSTSVFGNLVNTGSNHREGSLSLSFS